MKFHNDTQNCKNDEIWTGQKNVHRIETGHGALFFMGRKTELSLRKTIRVMAKPTAVSSNFISFGGYHDLQFGNKRLCLGPENSIGVAEGDGREGQAPSWVMIRLHTRSRWGACIAGPQAADHEASPHQAEQHHNHP
jgi:hypothetical protein